MYRCRSCGEEFPDGQAHQCAGMVFQKADKDKPRMELIDPEFMTGLAQVLTFGAKKYEAENWKKATPEDISRIMGAMLRHQTAHMGGETVDPETGLNHMYHIACNAMFLAYFDRHKGENAFQTEIDFHSLEDVTPDGGY